MFKKFIFENPELIRHVRVAFRQQRVISFTALYAVSLVIFYTLMYFLMSSSNRDFSLSEYSSVMYVINMGIIYLAHFYIGSYLTAHSLANEKEKGTFDFLRMTTIERKVLAIGKLFGGPIFQSYLILLNLLIVASLAYFGGIPLSHFAMVLVNLFVYGLMFHTISLFCAVSTNKISSANSLSLAIPMLYGIVSLTLPGRSSNPFYSLFIPLSPRIETTENLNFFGIYLPAYLLIASMILCLVYWLMKGIIRKLDSETNHLFTRKEGIKLFLLIQFFYAGFSFNSLYKGDIDLVYGYFIFFLLINSFLAILLSPSKEDSIIFINKTDEDKDTKNFLNSKSPVFSYFFLFSTITLLISLVYNLFVLYFGKAGDFYLTIYLSLLTTLFGLIYTQIFYYFNLIYSKNSSTISFIVIALSMLAPIPLGLFSKAYISSKADIFFLNPIASIVSLNKLNYFNLTSITQLITLTIIVLILNFLIMSKKENIVRKFKL